MNRQLDIFAQARERVAHITQSAHKQCRCCGHTWTADQWWLDWVRQGCVVQPDDAGIGEYDLQLVNCPCGSTMAMKVGEVCDE